MTTLLDYSLLIKKQNNNSSYPKLHYSNFVKGYFKDRETIVKKIVSNPTKCTGIIKTNNPIVNNTDSLYYYEFAHKETPDVFSRRNYYYAPIEDLPRLKVKVPFYNIVNFEEGTHTITFFNKNSLFKKTLNSSFLTIISYIDNLHPLLNHFLFSGKIYLLNNKFVYEYFDKEELFDSSEVNYYSLEEPENFRQLLNIKTKRSIYPASETAVPCRIHTKNEPRIYSFTGEMNNTLIKNKVLYKYIELKGTESFVHFSLEKPFFGDTSLIQQSIGKEKHLNFNVESYTRIKYKQQSNLRIDLNKQ